MESSDAHVVRGVDRRMMERRVNPDRRFGERRAGDRASAGRRVDFDRRQEERRLMDRRVFSPA
jgi:hypothetical protein